MYPLRTIFNKEILAEFFPPHDQWKKVGVDKKLVDPQAKVIILAMGMPTMPDKYSALEYWCKKGYWVFLPRYRGTWESGGAFLEKSPHEDILDVIDELTKGFSTSWIDVRCELVIESLVLIGSSFGGPAVLLSSVDDRVDKVITCSAVVDWTVRSQAEPLDWLYGAVKSAFGQGYRISKTHWNKLQRGTFYNPQKQAKQLPGQKILMFHACDDMVIDYHSVERFARYSGAKLHLYKKGGHFGFSKLMSIRFEKHIADFLTH